jgi:hypothetical protein
MPMLHIDRCRRKPCQEPRRLRRYKGEFRHAAIFSLDSDRDIGLASCHKPHVRHGGNATMTPSLTSTVRLAELTRQTSGAIARP